MKVAKGYEVNNGDVLGEILGFHDSLFSGWFEIYPDGRLYLHYICCKHPNSGHTKRLILHWEDMGFVIYVVRPNEIMKHILEKRGYIMDVQEISGYQDECEVMYKPIE